MSSSDDDDNHRPKPVKRVRFVDVQYEDEVEEGVGESMVMSDYSIYLQIQPSYWFMRALGVMMEAGINRFGVVTAEVTDDGLLFTARNPRTGASATLVYQAFEFRTFMYKPPPLLPPRMIYINPVVKFLFDHAPVDGPVSVCYAPRLMPGYLLFLCGLPPRAVPKQYEAELIDDNYKFTRNPIICEFPITTEVLREMLEHFHLLPYPGDQLVSVDVKSEVVKISIKLPNQRTSRSWKIEKSRSSPGMKYHALFKLPHLIFVRKATEISLDANLRFLTEPEKHVILQFILKEFGEIVFSFKPIELDKVPDDDPPGGDSDEASQSSSDSDEASHSSSPADEASHTDDDAADEASQSGGRGGDTAEASQSGGDAAEASQSSGDAAKALKPGVDAAEGSLSGGDAAEG